MQILITGGAGFVGANLSFYFKEKGHQIIAFDNLARRGSETNLPEFKKRGIEFIHGDIRNKEDFFHIKADVVLECSAQPSVLNGYINPVYDITNNLYGVFNVLEYARLSSSAVCMWSTNKVYCGSQINSIPFVEKETRYEWVNDAWDIPGVDTNFGISENFSVDGGDHSIYGMTKIQADLACQEYYDAFGVKTVCNRFSCLSGPQQWGISAQGWVTWFAIAAKFKLPIDIIGWKGKQVRDVLFVDDLCRLIELEIDNIDKIKGQVFNVGGGVLNTLSLLEAITMLENMLDVKIKTNILSSPRKADQVIYISDTRKIESILGWKPKTDIMTGYRAIIDWVNDNKSILERLYL